MSVDEPYNPNRYGDVLRVVQNGDGALVADVAPDGMIWVIPVIVLRERLGLLVVEVLDYRSDQLFDLDRFALA